MKLIFKWDDAYCLRPRNFRYEILKSGRDRVNDQFILPITASALEILNSIQEQRGLVWANYGGFANRFSGPTYVFKKYPG